MRVLFLYRLKADGLSRARERFKSRRYMYTYTYMYASVTALMHTRRRAYDTQKLDETPRELGCTSNCSR